MSEKYTGTFAFHYSAFRPPLHKMILERVLDNHKEFENGLDVGCGTGYSAVALAEYCRHVYGIDPSEEMLKQAAPHQKIIYAHGFGDSLPIPDDSINIVTFAGSLFYAKSQELVQELQRVCKKQAVIVPYDFEILLDDILQKCGIYLKKTISEYDHKVNFTGNPNFSEILAGNEQISLDVTATELAHVILADSNYFKVVSEKYNVSDPFSDLVRELEILNTHHCLSANIYFSKYILKAN